MTTPINKTTQLTRDQDMIAGIQKHKATVPSWILAGVSYTAQQAIDLLQARVDTALAVLAAKAAYANAVRAANAEAEKTKATVSSLRQVTYLMFSSRADTLADFGLTPHKERTPATAIQKVQAVELRKATRVVRHTMSKKAKEAIKGAAQVTVTVTTLAPSVPAQPMPPAAGQELLPMLAGASHPTTPQTTIITADRPSDRQR